VDKGGRQIDLSDYPTTDREDNPATCWTGAHLHYYAVERDKINNYRHKGNRLNSNRLIRELCNPIGAAEIDYGDLLLSRDQIPAVCYEAGGSQGIDPNVVPNVEGQSTTDTAPEFELSQSGEYQIRAGEQVFVKKLVIDEGGTASVQVFEDKNVDGEKNDDERYYSADEIEFTYLEEGETFEYEFNAGWNLVGFPFVAEEITNSTQLKEELGEDGINPIHVAKFNPEGFVVDSERGGLDTPNEFDIFPSDGIFIFSTTSGTAYLNGNRVNPPYPLNLNNGWNLVNITSETEYNSESLLNAMINQGLTPNTLSKFENGSYQSVVLNDNTLFGNNFNIISKNGYFIRIMGNGGEFTP
jgi:hypothetical protein